MSEHLSKLVAPPTDLTAPGAIEALIAFHRSMCGDLRMEGDSTGDPKEDPSGTGGAGDDKSKEPDYPRDKPLAEMTDAQQAAYWKAQSRKHEGTAKRRGDYDDVKKRADQYDALANASKTEQERAVEAARAEERDKATKEANLKAAPRLVYAEFRAQAAGKLTEEQVKELTEDLDMTKYLGDDGDVDTDRVARKVNAFAPKSDGKGGNSRGPDMGMGNRGGSAQLTAREQGKAEAAKRFGAKATATSST